MIYYKERKDRIEKYLIETDRDKLEELKNEIIQNCSEVSHEVKTGIKFIPKMQYDTSEIRNLQVEQNNSDLGITYDVEYDYYKYPYLVYIIDAFLSGEVNENIIRELYLPTKEFKCAKDKTKEVCEEILKNIGDKEKINQAVEEYDNLKKLKQSQLDPLLYYEDVRDCIEISLAGSMEYDEIEKFVMFFESDDELMKKELTKQKIKLKS